MANDYKDFAEKLRAFQKKAKEKAERQMKRVCLKAFQNIVQRTPVLTGCARGNWRISFSEPARKFESEVKDAGGGSTISVGSSQIMSGAKLGEDLYMCNSAPYIMRLEHGYSVQAPSGMVQITVDELAAAGYGIRL